LCIAPGFIDIHTHADFSLNHHPEQLSVLYQGVTTQVGGNCGFAVGQIDDTPPCSAKSNAGSNRTASRLGGGRSTSICGYWTSWGWARTTSLSAGTARRVKRSWATRSVRPRMRNWTRCAKRLRLCFEAGAFAFTTGLEYPPNSFAETEEIIELAKVAAQYGGFYATHLRSEGDQLIESVQEALRIAEEAGAAAPTGAPQGGRQAQLGQGASNAANGQRRRGAGGWMSRWMSTRIQRTKPRWRLLRCPVGR
jgi:N-acyl-D-amino-acid deacylase